MLERTARKRTAWVLREGLSDLNDAVNLAPGRYTLIAQAEDKDGLIGDPSAISLTVD